MYMNSLCSVAVMCFMKCTQRRKVAFPILQCSHPSQACWMCYTRPISVLQYLQIQTQKCLALVMREETLSGQFVSHICFMNINEAQTMSLIVRVPSCSCAIETLIGPILLHTEAHLFVVVINTNKQSSCIN